tara:strand:- start:1613 stop:2695 length:1083 start_codon:yes stop_codon:yes gene_type:complete
MGGICTTDVITLPDADSVLKGTQIPEWVSAAGRQLYEQSAEMAKSPFPTYTGARIASYNGSKLTPEEQEAGRLLARGTDTYSGYISDADRMAGMLGGGYDSMSREDLLGEDYQGATREELLGGGFTLENAQPFLDIYQKAQDAGVAEIGRQTDRGLISDAADAARMGAFGGSRLGLREATTASEGARAAGDLRSRAAAEGLNFAAGQLEQDRAARFRAEDAMRSRFDQERSARFGAEESARGAYETEEAARLRATQELKGFAPLVQGLNEQAASGLLTAGQAKRELDQMALDLAYADYVEQREYPFQMLNFAQGALQGTPYETRQFGFEQGQQFVQSPSIYGQTIGGLGSLLSAYYMGNR